jgi:hypothetical protein
LFTWRPHGEQSERGSQVHDRAGASPVTGGYVYAGYGITVGSLGLYTLRVMRRGRVLSRSLPGDVPLAESGDLPAAASPAPSPAPEA